MASEQLRFCVDLDGVIATRLSPYKGFEEIGWPRPGAQAFLKKLREAGRVIIFTSRFNYPPNDPPNACLCYDAVFKYLKKHKLPFDEIYNDYGKPYADVFFDDCAVHVPRNPTVDELFAALGDAQSLVNFPVSVSVGVE